MGLIVEIFKNKLYASCSLGGVSSRVDSLCIVNVDGPFEPADGRPAAILESHQPGILRIVPAVATDKGWKRAPGHASMGGCFAHTSDSRFARACEAMAGTTQHYGAIAIHDRYEF